MGEDMDRVGEQRVPLGWRPVARDDGRAAAHALADQLVEVLALALAEAAQPEVVEDEKEGRERGSGADAAPRSRRGDRRRGR